MTLLNDELINRSRMMRGVDSYIRTQATYLAYILANDRTHFTVKMDKVYPHKCVIKGCNNFLYYNEAFGKAKQKYMIGSPIVVKECNFSTKYVKRIFENARRAYDLNKQFKKWWMNPDVQFVCCINLRNLCFLLRTELCVNKI